MQAQGGLFVLDCIASGTVWTNMEELGVDVLISAPQKGWTGPSCAGLVMLGPRGVAATRATKGTSFVVDLRKWLELMDSYEAGGFMYHATMPTDALAQFRDVMLETKVRQPHAAPPTPHAELTCNTLQPQDFGFENAHAAAWGPPIAARTID